ncbi:MAG TPA: PQQ-binding-like beta-propeller repeat protein, partial [Bryobacteraceae bacterium]
GYAGRDSGVWAQCSLKAIDPQTGKVRWTHPYTALHHTGAGILSTAGKLLFTGDPDHHFVAFEPGTGRILWHVGLNGNVSNGPITYELDGHQYVLVASGDTLYSFKLLR